jgi:hypothetical protein
MGGSRKTISALVVLVSANSALAFDQGQFNDVPADVRAWFKNVTNPHGIPCCDIADGHRTDYDIRQNAYWVPIEGNWTKVPDDAVIRDAGNPVGQAVVWYVKRRDNVIIRCFVPGSGA